MSNELFAADVGSETVEELKRLLDGRTDSYEIFFSRSRGFNVEARDSAVDSLKVRSNAGVGVRTISSGRLGFGFSSVLAPDALSEMVSNALAASEYAATDEFLGLPEPFDLKQVDDAAESMGLVDPLYNEVTEESKIKCAFKIEAAAKDHDNRVARVRKASYNESAIFTRIVNSRGLDIANRATYYTGSVTAVAEQDGESQMGWEIGMGHKRDAIDPAQIGAGAARRAVALLGARKVKTVKCPAVIENAVACEFLESLAGSFLADNVAKGKSMLIDKVDRKVASGVINVWDDGSLKGGWASSVFDGEGVLKQRTPLLTDGVCRGYLYDTYWAGRASAASTGNASRSGYKGLPSVGISNLYIDSGRKTLEELFESMGKGLFITEVLGVHMINTVSGEFSLGASGFWVEDGKPSHPVRGMAISGTLLDLFSRVEACGSDVRFIGSIGAPSLLVSEIEASGS